jgi:hypothetical protein
VNVPSVVGLYSAFMEVDPTGKLAGAFLDGLRKAGEDVEQVYEAIAAGTTPAAPTLRPYEGAEHGLFGHPVAASARRGGRTVRQQLTGSARAELDLAMGLSHGGGAFGTGDGLPPIGPTRSPEGHLRIHLGCPGEWRRSQEARRNGR